MERMAYLAGRLDTRLGMRLERGEGREGWNWSAGAYRMAQTGRLARGLVCIGPVSYTHLDVYKRQRLNGQNQASGLSERKRKERAQRRGLLPAEILATSMRLKPAWRNQSRWRLRKRWEADGAVSRQQIENGDRPQTAAYGARSREGAPCFGTLTRP